MIVTVTLNGAIDKTLQCESLSRGKVNRGRVLYACAGGKGINVARALLALGAEKVLATGIFGRINGEFAQKSLKEEDIPSDFVKIRGESRICSTFIDKKGNYWGELNEHGPEMGGDVASEVKKKLDRLSKLADYVAFCGSIPPSLPQGLYFDLIEICKRNGTKTILDASGPALANAVPAEPWLVKINQIEAAFLFEIDFVKKEYLYKLFKDHKERFSKSKTNWAVTFGKNGSTARIGKRVFSSRLNQSANLETKSAVGSGDAYLAGFLFARSRRRSLETAFRYAEACGAANALSYGACRFSVAEAKKLLKVVEVSTVDRSK